jgi:hypothetical protein
MEPHSPKELNLVTHRTRTSVWNRRGWDGSSERASMIRVFLGVGGAALAIHGVREGTGRGRALAGLGGGLLWWALTGEGSLQAARSWFDRVLDHAPWNRPDLVSEASAESFPASDAPAWTPTVATGSRGGPDTR